ncbi:MAG TPA: hypothetical protein PLP17_14770, partial [Oligoflexia bacterium]|nr:hypothetical protein [Oligoflexia bacterium]
YNKSFSVNLQQLRAAGIEFVKITFYAAGVNLTNNFVEFNNIPPGTNPVALGTMKDGLNQFIIPVSQLQATNTISLLSGGTVVGGVFNYDDIEFWDLSVTWHP